MKIYNAIYCIGSVLIGIGALLFIVGFFSGGYFEESLLCKVGYGFEWSALALYTGLLIYDISRTITERKRK